MTHAIGVRTLAAVSLDCFAVTPLCYELYHSMKVAFTHNLRLTDVRETEKEAEYDSAETVNAIAAALEAAGHEVEKVEVSGPASNLLERLEAIDPDIIFNTAEGERGRMREAFYPALFEELGIPYTGSRRVHERDHARQVADQADRRSAPASTPRAACSSPCATSSRCVERGAGLAFPVIVKPNHEGSSKGIYNGALGSLGGRRSRKDLAGGAQDRAARVPRRRARRGVHRRHRRRGRLHRGRRPRRRPAHAGRARCSRPTRRAAVQHLRLPAQERRARQGAVPLPGEPAARRRGAAAPDLDARSIRTLGLRDVARLDYRVTAGGPDLPARGQRAARARVELVAVRGDRAGRPDLQRDDRGDPERGGAALGPRDREPARRRAGSARSQPIRVGFTYNVKRSHDGDDEAEWDPPETIIAIANALARQGHIVVHLEATPDLPRVLAEADVDLIFNIAEGVEGRNREAQVPGAVRAARHPVHRLATRRRSRSRSTRRSARRCCSSTTS